MDIDTMNAHLESFLRSCADLAKRKNRDYHPDGVAMLEILETSFETGIRPEQDLWGRLKKQLGALRRYTIDGVTESEPPQGRMRDVANYMAIMDFWATCKITILNDAYEFVIHNRPCEGALPCLLSNTDRCENCRFANWLAQQLLDASSAT